MQQRILRAKAATPEKRANKRAMLIPKTGHYSDHLPTIMDFSDAPRAGRVLREIVETADLVQENGHTYLVARISSYTVDTLAAFEAERADLEPDGSDEPEETDREHDGGKPDHDDEDDCPRALWKYIAERQQPGRECEWRGRRYVIPPRVDAAKDQEEIQKIKRQVSTLVSKKRKRVKA